jgi:uncharacterized protein YeaO (DUF488 family)
MIRARRIYEPPARGEGTRVLVMRLWPRGIRREAVDLWLRELGPEMPLLRAFLDGTITWAQYRPRFLAGLARPAAQEAVARVRALARRGPVTLLCGCADAQRCHRTLLAGVLGGRGGTLARAPEARSAPRRRGGMTKTARKGMRAYVLIETAAGNAKAVKKALSRLDGGESTVVHLDGVTGPYDFIAVVEGPTLDAIGRLVTDEIGVIDGVTRTTTCVAVSIG